MSNSSKFVEVEKSKAPGRPAWANLTGGQKAVRVLQVMVCIVSFGMLFPNAIS